MHILALSGSYRHNSFNMALLRSAIDETADGVTIDLLDLREVPHYDGDLEAAGDPAAVTDLKTKIAEADGVLIATPEYNGGIPGVLKNGIDWASRGHPASVWANKPVAVMGATPGRGATDAAQTQLRTLIARIGGKLVDEPRLAVATASDHIVDRAVSDDLAGRIRAVVDALVRMTEET